MIQGNLFKKALKFLEVTYLNQQELNTTAGILGWLLNENTDSLFRNDSFMLQGS